MKNTSLLAIVLLSILSACSTTPKVLKGDFTNLTPTKATARHIMDKSVRWSGLIVKTHNQKTRTCFEIIEMETKGSSLRPKRIIPKNSSRFLACKDGFLEPIAFNNRLVTITGNIVAYSKQHIGDYEMEYPILKTDVIYIWQKQQRNNAVAFNSYFPQHFSCFMSLFPSFCY